MTKKSLLSLYSLFAETFWTAHRCQKCQISFTSHDYQTHNYQLDFIQLLKIEQSCLTTLIQLTHQQCCTGCLNFITAIKNDHKKKITPTNRNY